jgi:hypothetical protein
LEKAMSFRECPQMAFDRNLPRQKAPLDLKHHVLTPVESDEARHQSVPFIESMGAEEPIEGSGVPSGEADQVPRMALQPLPTAQGIVTRFPEVTLGHEARQVDVASLAAGNEDQLPSFGEFYCGPDKGLDPIASTRPHELPCSCQGMGIGDRGRGTFRLQRQRRDLLGEHDTTTESVSTPDVEGSVRGRPPSRAGNQDHARCVHPRRLKPTVSPELGRGSEIGAHVVSALPRGGRVGLRLLGLEPVVVGWRQGVARGGDLFVTDLSFPNRPLLCVILFERLLPEAIAKGEGRKRPARLAANPGFVKDAHELPLGLQPPPFSRFAPSRDDLTTSR